MNVVTGPDNKQILIQMISAYEKDLLRTCYVYLRDASLAEDAVQETFLRAYKHLDSFRGESSQKTWLMSIALNVCRSMRQSAWYRYVDRYIELDTLNIAAESIPELNIALMTEIMRLPRKEMEAIWLYYYEDMKLKEIASALGVSTSAIGARLDRARDRLHKALEGKEDDFADE